MAAGTPCETLRGSRCGSRDFNGAFRNANMVCARRLTLLLFCLLVSLTGEAAARMAVGPVEAFQQAREVRDLADIRRVGELRVLINQSRNSSGEVKDQAIGVEYVRLRSFEQYLNRDPGKPQIRLRLIPKPKDQLLGALRRGEGDLVAPGERMPRGGKQDVVGGRPVVDDVRLLLVGRKGGPAYRSLDQLSGRSIALSAGSAAGPVLSRINRDLLARNKAPVVIEWVDPTLAVEDVLEMVQAGIFPATVVEETIARRWAKVMPKLRIDPKIAFGEPDDMNWYTARKAPMLRAGIDRFLKDYRAPANRDDAFVRVYRRLYKVQAPLDRTGRQRLDKVSATLQRHASAHDLDWLNLAALAFKESTLNPSARGASGAVGLMQVTPATARSMGVSNVTKLENNVEASARYLASIRRKFFSSPRLNERERMAFVLAAYNMGPQRVQTLRAEARRRGLNPDQWFFQVERVAMEQVGMGVVSYVNSVNKYYQAYARERILLEAGRRSASN